MIDYPHQTNLFQGIRLLCRLQGSVMYARGPQRPPVPRHSARHVPKLKSLASRRGSPRCLPLFFLSAALAMLFQDDRLFINRPIKELFSHPYAHQVFALSVGYGLVMRCNLAYNRWWEAMGHVRLMFSKFHDASTPRAAAVSALRAQASRASSAQANEPRLRPRQWPSASPSTTSQRETRY